MTEIRNKTCSIRLDYFKQKIHSLFQVSSAQLSVVTLQFSKG
jgi:hypothetical protein